MSSSNNREDADQTRRRRRARPAMICSRRAPPRFPFAATASRRKDSRSPSFSCSLFQNGAPLALPPPHHEAPGSRDRSRSTRSWLPSRLPLLKLSRSFLRVSRRCSLDGRTNHYIAPVRSRHRAANQNHFLGLAHLHHLQVLHGHALIAHVTRHAHVLPDASRRGTVTDGAVPPMRLRTVGRALSGE